MKNIYLYQIRIGWEGQGEVFQKCLEKSGGCVVSALDHWVDAMNEQFDACVRLEEALEEASQEIHARGKGSFITVCPTTEKAQKLLHSLVDGNNKFISEETWICDDDTSTGCACDDFWTDYNGCTKDVGCCDCKECTSKPS